MPDNIGGAEPPLPIIIYVRDKLNVPRRCFAVASFVAWRTFVYPTERQRTLADQRIIGREGHWEAVRAGSAAAAFSASYGKNGFACFPIALNSV